MKLRILMHFFGLVEETKRQLTMLLHLIKEDKYSGWITFIESEGCI